MTPEELQAFQAEVRSLTYDRGKVLSRFIPKVDFFAPEFGSQYCAGELYYVTEARNANGDVVQSPLQRTVPQWIAEGKVEAA